MHKLRFLSFISVLILLLGLSIADSFPYVWAVSPAVAQVATNDCSACTTVSKAFTSSVTAGNILIVFVLCLGGNCINIVPPTDTLGNTFNSIIKDTSGGALDAQAFGAVSKSSGADTITETPGSSVSMGIHDFEISGSTVGFVTSHSGSTGVACGCAVSSYSPAANTLTLVGAVTNGNPAGTWTFTGSMTGVSGVNFDIDASEYGTLTGAQTFPMSMSQAIASGGTGWSAVSVSFNIVAPADFNVVNNAGGSAQTNANINNATCTLPYVFSGNTILLIMGIVGAGNTIFTPSDSIGSSFTSQYSAGSVENPEIIAYTSAISKNAIADSITQKFDGSGGHSTVTESCYQIQGADLGAPLFLTNLHGNTSGSPTGCNSNTFCNVPESGLTNGLFGVDCTSAVCFNEVVYSLSGTGTNSCPTLMTFKNANTQSGNTAGAEDSKVQAFCGTDPGSSNKLVQVDNYGVSGFSTGTTPYKAISNITTGGVLGGAGFGAIFGFQSPTVTSTITGWVFPNFANCQGSGSPQCGTSVNWLFGMIVLLLPVGIIDSAFIEISDNIDRHVLVFLTLLGLMIGAILGAMLNFLPLAVPFAFVIIFGLYLWRGRG